MSYKIEIVAIILVSFVWHITSFSQQFLGNTQHPEMPNHCYFEDYNISVPVNKTVYPTNLDAVCFKVYCREDFVLIIKHCDRVSVYHYYEKSRYDYSKPYPKCCPIIKY